ncbi:MAG: diguanylate cyclase [Mariprofundales bacterium]
MEWMFYSEKNPSTECLANAIDKNTSNAIDKYILISASDLKGNIVGVSRAFCTLSGFQSHELTSKSYKILRHSQMPQALFEELWKTIKAGKIWVGEIINRTKDKGFFWVTAEITPVFDTNHSAIGYIAFYQNITELKALENLSITDPMTNAYNRRYFEKIIPVELARAKREKTLLCFLMADADHFKRYNDTYGHFAGDNVIKTIVDALHETFQRPGDLIFRLGGEEFAALYAVNKNKDALKLAHQARQNVYDRDIEHTSNSPANRITISIGVIVIEPDEENDMDSIYKYSDIALYRAKKSGRNRVELHGDAEAEIDLF